MDDQTQAVFQKAFRSGIVRAYNLSLQSNIINDPERFYSNFQQHVAIWNPNIPEEFNSTFPVANNVIWKFPLKESSPEIRDLPHLCVSSPFDSFGRAISCLTMPYVSLGLLDAPPSDLDIAAKYGVYADVATIPSITKAWAGYLHDSGDSSPDCAIDVLIQKNATLDLQMVSKCMRLICKDSASQANVDPDIIGIGVWAAYIIQLGICFFAPILAALFRRLSEKNISPSCPGSHSSQSGGTSTQTDVEQK
ncbi:hypothetical protein BS50DRAFT_616468, partial [Corynespora cassiicola Philippines]